MDYEMESLRRRFLKQGLTLALLGLVLGLAGAAAATRILSSLLFGVKASDPTTYLGVAALLGIVALAATYIPVMRAAKIDPWSPCAKNRKDRKGRRTALQGEIALE